MRVVEQPGARVSLLPTIVPTDASIYEKSNFGVKKGQGKGAGLG